MKTAVLWRHLDTHGADSAILERNADGWRLSGFAAFLDEGRSCGLGYEIQCTQAWYTKSAKVVGHIGTRPCVYEIEVTEGVWRVNGVEASQIQGCTDIDLGFTPATNLLPVRRLALTVGDSSKITAAWLQFPSMAFVVSEQIYRRTSATQYHYQSLVSNFSSTLTINSDGFVTSYPNLWQVESFSALSEHDPADR